MPYDEASRMLGSQSFEKDLAGCISSVAPSAMPQTPRHIVLSVRDELSSLASSITCRCGHGLSSQGKLGRKVCSVNRSPEEWEQP